MKLIPQLLLAPVAWAFALGVSAAEAPPKIYACKDASGEIVYQDDECSAPVVRKGALANRAPAPAAAAAPVPSPARAIAPRRVPVRAPAPMWILAPPPAPPPIPPPGRTVDVRSFSTPPAGARWASPESTLQTFIAAVKGGDRALIRSCLTSSALAEIGTDPESVPLEKLRETVGSFTGYVAEGDLGPYWSIRALRAGTRPKWIFFEKNRSGEWKIGAI